MTIIRQPNKTFSKTNLHSPATNTANMLEMCLKIIDLYVYFYSRVIAILHASNFNLLFLVYLTCARCNYFVELLAEVSKKCE